MLLFSYFWPAVVVAALNIAAGFVVIRHPEESAEAFTIFAALLFLMFLTGGVFRLVGGVVVRGPHFGWTLLQGSPALLFDGVGLIAIGVGGRRIAGLVSERMAPPDDTEAPEAGLEQPEKSELRSEATRNPR